MLLAMSDSYKTDHAPKRGQLGRYLHQPIISDQIDAAGLETVCAALQQTLSKGIAGDVVEFGCYVGTTSLFLQRLLTNLPQPQPVLHVYDSFEGLPEKGSQDISPSGQAFQAGMLSVSKKTFQQQFLAAGLPLPVIHKAWFNQLQDTDLPASIAFGFLDGDFYQSILTSLQLVWPRLSPGGCLVIDDYGRSDLPGAKKAVESFLTGRSEQPKRQQQVGSRLILERVA